MPALAAREAVQEHAFRTWRAAPCCFASLWSWRWVYPVCVVSCERILPKTHQAPHSGARCAPFRALIRLGEFMGFLAGKRILLTGLLSNRSIAYGIAQACRREGAELAFTYVGDRFKDRITEFATEFGSNLVFPCDVGDDAQIEALFTELKKHWDSLDGVVHSIGFAPREAIAGDFLDGMTRENFRIAHDISAYSFPALAKAALPMLSQDASLLTLTYLGAERAIPNYNTMGLAKASLEASVRYLAVSLGSKGVRVNGISAGPIKTLAASGIKSFGKILDFVEHNAPLRRNVTIEQVGNTAAFLLSDLAGGVTAEIVHVDSGFNAVVGGMAGLSE
jgi:enoyl-[acyl-carrier protein] reductase I